MEKEDIINKWARTLRDSAISEEDAIKEAINEVLSHPQPAEVSAVDYKAEYKSIEADWNKLMDALQCDTTKEALSKIDALSPPPVRHMSERHEQLFEFLLGTGELDGLYFGDRKGLADFWWRNDLRDLRSFIQSQQPVTGLVPKEMVVKAFQELKDAINDKGCMGNAELIGGLVWKYFDEFNKDSQQPQQPEQGLGRVIYEAVSVEDGLPKNQGHIGVILEDGTIRYNYFSKETNSFQQEYDLKITHWLDKLKTT